MRTFLISYDLARPNRNKHVLATAIMSLGQSWARPLEQTWYVRADVDETDIESRLAGLLDCDDGLIVQVVSDDAWRPKRIEEWAKSGPTPSDRRTYDGSRVAEVQADPEDSASSFKPINIASPST